MGVQKHYIGETFTANNGMKFTIISIDRTSKKPFTIQFEDGYTTNVYNSFVKDGAKIRNYNLDHHSRIDRTGEQNRHKDGSLMTIIKYIDCTNVLVEFDDSSISKTTYGQFTNGTCKHKIRIFDKDYDMKADIEKHFKLSSDITAHKSASEIEEYIINNRIEYNGEWIRSADYVRAHGIKSTTFTRYLRDRGIENNVANIKRYLPEYLRTKGIDLQIESKVDTEIDIKTINNYFGTSFKSLRALTNDIGISYTEARNSVCDNGGLIEYIKQHCVQYNGQLVSVKYYLEKQNIDLEHIKAWAKVKGITISASNIDNSINSYRNDMNTGYIKLKVNEIQKLKHLGHKYITINRADVINHMYIYFNHNNLSAEQVIVHFRPDLHINIFGKIVDENGNEV